MMRFTLLLAVASVVALTVATEAVADGKHKHVFAADVEAFHAKLSPLWHAAASTERNAAVCQAAPELLQLATAITSADASALKQAVEKLQKQCSNDIAAIDVPFGTVHDAFHAIADEH